MKAESKKAAIVIAAVLIITVSIYLYMNKAPKDFTEMIPTSGGRSYNNPGNIEYKNSKNLELLYQGEVLSPGSNVYRSFASQVYGFRAMVEAIKHIYNAGYASIGSMISRYSGGDNAAAYTNYVAGGMSITNVTDLGSILDDDNETGRLITLMAQWEQGHNYTVSVSDVATGVSLA